MTTTEKKTTRPFGGFGSADTLVAALAIDSMIKDFEATKHDSEIPLTDEERHKVLTSMAAFIKVLAEAHKIDLHFIDEEEEKAQ